ncbi:hypothetical protein BH23GEM11_BH23GEM11_08790 [soil metagenome]
MSDEKLGTGFKYGKMMAWGPAILVVFALVTLVLGEIIIGVSLLAFAMLMLFYVSRRRKAAAAAGRPAGTP